MDKTINGYLNDNLLNLNTLKTQLDGSFADRLFVKKFRKYSIDPTVKTNTEEKLNNIIGNKLPLTFVPSFGGYKHWWSPDYPSIGWAEVFNMKFMLEWLSPIFCNYESKVEIEYESEEIILSELNNVPQSGLDEYTKTFRQALDYFNTLLKGKNCKMKLSLAREQYEGYNFSKEKLLGRIDEMLPECRARFEGYEKDDQERRIKKATTNFKLDGVQDFTLLSDKEKYELYKNSRILNEAFLDADFEIRGTDFFDKPTNIPLLFSFGLGPGGEFWPHVGSSSSSMVDFWAGVGILELRDNGNIVERILSQTQFENIKDKLIRVEVSTPLRSISKNFSYIYVYKGSLNF